MTGVSRETVARLERYAVLLATWQTSLNLVGSASLNDLWRRHMLDSAQLFELAPGDARCWVDLGSGAGFPGLVLAIMGARDVHLIESNARKCSFLHEAARVAGVRVTIHNARIESLSPWQADVVTARALAPLNRLCGLAHPFLGNHSVCLFPKGQDVDKDLTEASKYWKMTVECFSSRSDPSGVILRIAELTHG